MGLDIGVASGVGGRCKMLESTSHGGDLEPNLT